MLAEQLQRAYKDLKTIEPLTEYSYKDNSLDLMFIIDCTDTMGPWIAACRNKIADIINFVKTQFFKMNVRVSFIGYRDYFTENSKDALLHFNVFKFSSDMSACASFLSKLQPLSNEDLCEDVAGGLKMGLQQEWKSTLKYAILIADYPNHGSKYWPNPKKGSTHKYDSYPNGKLNAPTIESLIRKYADQNICFNAVSITEETNVMYSIMN